MSIGTDPAARTGPVEVEPGQAFLLHAVLEAREGERRIFYTEAESLVVEGESIPPEDLRVWEGPEHASILWFTVEGSAPIIDADDRAALDGFRFEEYFRAGWARNWSILGSVQPLRETALSIPSELRPQHGTMRFHVRVELFGESSEIRPEGRFASLGAAALPEAADRFATVTIAEPGPLRTPSSVFGLTHFEGSSEVIQGIDLPSWVRRRLGFSRAAVLKVVLQEAGREWSSLQWREIDLAEGPAVDFVPGALVRAGDRLVYLYRDRGAPGVDYDDLALDLEEGARVLPLADIFAGSGLVELATLTE